MTQIKTSIEIPGTRPEIWNALMDFDSYPEWNPFITSIRGRPVPGNRLEVRLKLRQRKPVLFRPIVMEIESEKKLVWRGRLLFPGIFTGIHSFELLPGTGGQILFEQKEEFTGILVSPLLSELGEETEMAFYAMNRELKKRIIHTHEECSYHDRMLESSVLQA